MAARRGNVHLDDLEERAKQIGLALTRNRIRQQMHNWKNGKLIASPAQSVFRLTEAGLAAVADDGDTVHKDTASRNTEPSDDTSSEGSDVVGAQANGQSDFFPLAAPEHSRGGT